MTLLVTGKGIKRFALYSTAFVIVFVLLSPYIIGWVMNSSIIKKKLSLLIQQETGVIITPEKMDFTFLPRPRIHLKEIEFSFDKAIQLDVKAVHIDLDTRKLLQGKVIVSRIFVETPDFQYIPGRSRENSDPDKDPSQSILPKEYIQKLFSLLPDNQKNLDLFIKDARSDYFESMDGSIQVDTIHGSLILNAEIHGVQIKNNLFSENSFIKNLDIHSIDARDITLDLKLEDTGEVTGNIKIREPRVLSPKSKDRPMAGDLLDLDFKFSNELLTAQLKPFVISYPQAQIAIDFSDDKTTDQTSLKFMGNNIDISQARQVCLKFLGSNWIIRQLFDILRGGIAKNVTMGFKSNTLATLFDGKKLFLKGTAVNSLVKIPETPLLAENVHGDAIIEKGILHVKAQKGNIGSTAIKNGILDVDLVNYKDFPFSGEFNLHADLATLPGVLISLLPETLLAKELALVSQISGQADGVLKIAMATEQEELDIDVQAKKISAKGFYERIPLPIIITRGEFRYKKDRVDLKNFSGFLNTSSLENLSASFDFTKDPYFDIRSARARLRLNELMPWFQSHKMAMDMISPIKPSRGELIVDSIKIQGPILDLEKWNFDIKGSGENISLGFLPGKLNKPDQSNNHDSSKKPDKTDTPDKPDRIQIQAVSGRFEANNQDITAKDIKARIEDLSWLFKAIAPPWLNSIKLPLHVSGTRIENKNNKALLKGQLTFPSGSELSFDLTGKNIKDLFPSVLLLKDKDLSNVMVMFTKDPSQPVLNFKGMLNTTTLEQLLIKDSFLYDQLISLTAGNPIKTYIDASSNLHLDLEIIDLDSFISSKPQNKVEANPLTPGFRSLFSHKTLFLTARKLKYKQRTFTDIDTKLFFTKEKTNIQILHGALCDLDITGKMEILHGKNKIKTDFNIQVLEKEDIADMVSCLFRETALIDGTYSFSSDFQGQNSSNRISNSQNGVLSVHAVKGRIYKLTLLSRLLSVLNILKTPDITQKGFGYRAIDVQADIRNSVIHLKKAVIDGDDMALIFTGWIDPLNDELDLTCLVAPFKTIDTIIKHIPIVNTILGRLALLPAKATGKISDPVVTPLHPSAVGKGLVNMLKNIIKAPGRIFEENQ